MSQGHSSLLALLGDDDGDHVTVDADNKYSALLLQPLQDQQASTVQPPQVANGATLQQQHIVKVEVGQQPQQQQVPQQPAHGFPQAMGGLRGPLPQPAQAASMAGRAGTSQPMRPPLQQSGLATFPTGVPASLPPPMNHPQQQAAGSHQPRPPMPGYSQLPQQQVPAQYSQHQQQQQKMQMQQQQPQQPQQQQQNQFQQQQSQMHHQQMHQQTQQLSRQPQTGAITTQQQPISAAILQAAKGAQVAPTAEQLRQLQMYQQHTQQIQQARQQAQAGRTPSPAPRAPSPASQGAHSMHQQPQQGQQPRMNDLIAWLQKQLPAIQVQNLMNHMRAFGACKTPEQKNEWNLKLRNLVGTKLLFEFQQQANLGARPQASAAMQQPNRNGQQLQAGQAPRQPSPAPSVRPNLAPGAQSQAPGVTNAAANAMLLQQHYARLQQQQQQTQQQQLQQHHRPAATQPQYPYSYTPAQQVAGRDPRSQMGAGQMQQQLQPQQPQMHQPTQNGPGLQATAGQAAQAAAAARAAQEQMQRAALAGKRPADQSAADPAAKRVKKEGDVENDVLKASGINLEEEESRLVAGRERSAISQAALPKETLCINRDPFNQKAREIAREHGLPNVSPELCRAVSLGLEAHLGNLLRRAFVVARQRADVGRRLPGMEIVGNVRKQVQQIAKKEQELAEAKEAAEREKLMVEAKKKAADDKTKERMEKLTKAQDEKIQASAANAAAQLAFGSNARWSRWGAKKDAAKPDAGAAGSAAAGAAAAATPGSTPAPAAAAGSASAAAVVPSGAAPAAMKADGSTGVAAQLGMRAAALMQPAPGERRALALRDLIAVLERDPMYAKSTLLYKLYERLG